MQQIQTTQKIINQNNAIRHQVNAGCIVAPKESNAAISYIRSLQSAGSRDTMYSRLNSVAKYFGFDGLEDYPWGELTSDHLLMVRHWLAERKLAPSSVNIYLSALKGTAKEAWRLRQLSSDEYHHIQDVGAVKGTRISKGRRISDEELSLIFTHLSSSTRFCDIRDIAIIAIFISTGIRKSELLGLNYGSINTKEKTITVLGKGNKQRKLALNDDAYAYLDKWCCITQGDDWPTESDIKTPVFTRIRKNEELTSERLGDSGLTYSITKLANELGVDEFGLHDFRRTFATNRLDEGVDINLLRLWLGHSNITTTQRYDMRTDNELLAIGREITLPTSSAGNLDNGKKGKKNAKNIKAKGRYFEEVQQDLAL